MSYTLRDSKFKLHYSHSAGFTLLEIVIALGVVAIISVFSVSSFLRVNRDRALTTEVEKVLSLVGKARSFTLSAKDGGAYGVHFEQGKVVLFLGPVYTSGSASNETQVLNKEVRISSISLAGGGSDVVFSKLTGKTAQSGTITFSLVSTAGVTKVITIATTGTAYSN